MKGGKTNNYYKGHISIVLNYLDNIFSTNWSDNELEFRKATSIGQLAKIANMSKRNLQIIFQAYMNETIGAYKNRLRLEHAQHLLKIHGKSITGIANSIGFSNTSAFCNEFKKNYRLSPSQKKRMLLKEANITPFPPSALNYRLETLNNVHIIYLSYIGNYNLLSSPQFEKESWNRLEDFASKYKLLTQNTEYWGIAFDDTDITEEGKCRFYAAITIDSSQNIKLPITEEIKQMTLPQKNYAVYTYQGPYNKLDNFYNTILFSVDFEIDTTPILEKYLNSPTDTPDEELVTEIWIPFYSN